jgi:Fur family ferric uptake transcriptional regulator
MPRKAPIRDFEAVIRQGGYRVTPQRQLILEAVRAGKGHSTPEQIYSRVTRTAPSLNRATVYRGLDFLTSQHLITCVDVGTGGKVYEMAAEYPHHHLVCERCGRIERVDHASVRRAFRQIERTYDFTVTTDHLALFGVCSRCRKRAGRAHHR